jgi:hypothetical protein
MTRNETALLAAIATSKADPKDTVGKEGAVRSGVNYLKAADLTRRAYSGVMTGLAKKGLVVCYAAGAAGFPTVALTDKGLEMYLATLMPASRCDFIHMKTRCSLDMGHAGAHLAEPEPASGAEPATATEPEPAAELAPAAAEPQPEPAAAAEPTAEPDQAAWAAQLESYIASSFPPPEPPKPTPEPGAKLSPAQKAWVTRRAMAAAKAAAGATAAAPK